MHVRRGTLVNANAVTEFFMHELLVVKSQNLEHGANSMWTDDIISTGIKCTGLDPGKTRDRVEVLSVLTELLMIKTELL